MSALDVAQPSNRRSLVVTLTAIAFQFLPIAAIKIGYVQTTIQTFTAVVAVAIVVAAIVAWLYLPHFRPVWLRKLCSLLLLAWSGVLAVVLALSFLLAAPLELKQELRVGDHIVRAYVGCDGATTDPCVVVRQERRLAPGLVQAKELYRTWGREFTLTVGGSRNLRLVAPEFVGERRRPPLSTDLALAAWP